MIWLRLIARMSVLVMLVLVEALLTYLAYQVKNLLGFILMLVVVVVTIIKGNKELDRILEDKT